MRKWLIRVGYLLIVVAFISVSSLVDFLPVEFSLWDISGWLLGSNKPMEHEFYKAVSTENNINYFFIITFSIGLMLVLLGRFGIE